MLYSKEQAKREATRKKLQEEMKQTYRVSQTKKMQKCLPNLRLLTGLSAEEFGYILGYHTPDGIQVLGRGEVDMTQMQYLALRSVFVHLSKDNKYLARAMHEILNADKTEGEVYAAVMTITGLVRCGIEDEDTIDRMISEALGEGYEKPKDTLDDWI